MVIARSWDWQEGACMALLSQKPPKLAPNHDRRDAPPRRVLPLVVVETCSGELRSGCLGTSLDGIGKIISKHLINLVMLREKFI